MVGCWEAMEVRVGASSEAPQWGGEEEGPLCAVCLSVCLYLCLMVRSPAAHRAAAQRGRESPYRHRGREKRRPYSDTKCL